jgi:signal transduction histidine kinase
LVLFVAPIDRAGRPAKLGIGARRAGCRKKKAGKVKATFGLRAALIVLVLIAIAPVFAIVAQASIAEQETRLERARAELASMVDLAAAHQEQLIDGARQVLAAIAYSPAVYGDDRTACAAYMQRLQTQYPLAYGTFGVLDASGNLTCRSGPPAATVNSSDRLFFRTAVATGRFAVGEQIVSRANGRPILAFGLPVYRGPDQQLRGVAYLALDIGQADQQLRKLELSPEIALLVADRNGNVVAASGARNVSLGVPMPEAFLRAAVGQQSEREGRATGADGQEWLYDVQPVGRAGEGVLYVAGLVSTADVRAPGTRSLQLQLAALALIALLAAATAWAFGDRILTRPVQRLLDRVEALERGELGAQPLDRPSRLRELRELERRFHAMARALLERAVQRDGAIAEMAGQNKLLESILESMDEGVFVLDSRGRFVHTNSASLRIMPGIADLRREKDPLSTTPVEWGVFHLDGTTPVAREDRPAARVLGGEDLQHFRYVIRGRLSGGGEKVIDGHARALYAPEGRQYGAVVVFSDITLEYRSEQELRRLNESLERRVAERTCELAVSNRELESFSYSVSHDLRAPLQVIDGFGRALLTRHRSQLDEQARHYLERIGENTRQMGLLIDDLLSLARVTRTQIRSEPVDLAPRARQIVDRLRQQDPLREVVVEIDPGIPCEGDAGLLSVVLANLVENAWKFTSRTASARIRIGSEISDSGETIFFVADNGAGFDMAYADKLFNAFQRLHSASEFLGTGIGLATVHRIVTRHGGRVWAESAPGAGATFRFTLKGSG